MLKTGAEAAVAVINCLSSSRRKLHDQAVGKSVEQKPEIIPGENILDRSLTNRRPTNLWSSGPLSQRVLGPKDLRTKASGVNEPLVLGALGPLKSVPMDFRASDPWR